MATIKDVARVANVSPATVSRCLNGSAGVHPETLARVMSAVRELNYQPNIVARSLVRNESNLIGIIVPDVSAPFVAEIVRAVEDAATLSGYGITLCSTDWDVRRERQALRIMYARKVDGVVLFPAEVEPHLKMLQEYGVPTVVMSRYSPDFDSVETDNEKAGHLVARHLTDLGFTNLVFVGNSKSPKHIGFRAGALSAHVPDENIDVWELESNDGPIDAGYRLAMLGLRKTKELSVGIFAKNDLVAVGVMQAAEELGVSIPEDLAIVGFDNMVVGRVTRPRLTSVAQPSAELGRASMERLLERIRAGGGDQEREHVVMNPRLVVRGSTVKHSSDRTVAN